MPLYRIFVLSTPDKKIEGTHTIFCASDSEAISRAAEHLQGGQLVEIWQSTRVVKHLRSEDAKGCTKRRECAPCSTSK
jgi:hypothetical protein